MTLSLLITVSDVIPGPHNKLLSGVTQREDVLQRSQHVRDGVVVARPEVARVLVVLDVLLVHHGVLDSKDRLVEIETALLWSWWLQSRSLVQGHSQGGRVLNPAVSVVSFPSLSGETLFPKCVVRLDRVALELLLLIFVRHDSCDNSGIAYNLAIIFGQNHLS